MKNPILLLPLRGLALLVFSLFFLASCGGGGGGSNISANMEVINGIPVPPEPDTTVNNATIAGVDSNNNGVRDDVEREIAKTSPTRFTDAINLSANYQKIITKQLDANVTDYEKFNCLQAKVIDALGSNEFENIVLNSEKRKALYVEWLSRINQSDARLLKMGDLCNE